MTAQTIHKAPGGFPVARNLLDYEQTCTAFSWRPGEEV